MRIAVVSPHLPTPSFPMRGVRHSEQLHLFAAAGHVVQGVVPFPWAPWRDAPREETDGPVPIAHPRYLRVPDRIPRHAGFFRDGRLAVERWAFSRAVRSVLDRPDVVLAHSAGLPGGLLGRIGATPLVVVLHDHELFELAPRSPLMRRLLASTLRGAAAAVYVSESLRRRGIDLAGPHETRVIPIGIDTFDDLERAAAGPFTVCCVTRLIPRKRVDRLVGAFGRLARELPEARLRVVGDGPERGALMAQARALRLDDRVEFLGELDRRGALQEIARANVMALPSVMESLGAVYFEAMSLGVPALGTAGEGIAAHVEHGVDGILVPSDDDDRLYEELRRLALEPERARRIGEAGRRRFMSSGPTWRANVAAFLELFDEVCRRRADRP